MKLKRWVFVVIIVILALMQFDSCLRIKTMQKEIDVLKSELSSADIERAFLIAENLDLQEVINSQKEMIESK